MWVGGGLLFLVAILGMLYRWYAEEAAAREWPQGSRTSTPDGKTAPQQGERIL